MKLNRLAKRGVVIAAFSLTIAALVVPGTFAATLASDVVPTPDSPRPINVLPSTVRGSLPLTGVPGSQQYLATMLYSYAREPAFWDAVRRQNAGTATAGEIELVQQRNGTYAVPSTRLATLGKLVGGVSTAVGGYSVGAMIGAGTLELFGFDAAGTVCKAATGIAQDALALVTGQDCGAWAEMQPDFVPNLDAVATPLGYKQLPHCWGGRSPGLWNGNCYLMFIPNEGAGFQPTQTGTATVTILTERAQGSFQAARWCRNTTSGAISTPSAMFAANVGSNQQGQTRTFSWTCAAGTVLYAVMYGAAASNNVTPDATYAANSATADARSQWWFGNQASPNYQPAGTGDPLRTLRCILVHSGGTLTMDSATFRESDGVLPQVRCPDVQGLTVESMEIREVNLEDGSWGVLWTQETTPEYQTAHELAPECANGTCMLDLRKGDKSCFQAPATCEGWFADPNKESTYSCKYGTHAVDLAECTVYAPAFEPGSSTTGNTYGDPASGAAVTNPNPVSGSDPDGSGRACWPSGWAAFNPLEWVYRPLVCAFVPRETVVQAIGVRVTDAWADTLPAQAPAIVQGWTAHLPTGVGGCQGPPIDLGPAVENFGVEGVEPMYPLSACEEPWAGLAFLSRTVSTMFVIIGGAFAIVRYIAATIGFTGFGKDQGAAS